MSIKKVRNLQRATVKALNDPRVYLDNPDIQPAFDRSSPIPSDQKAYALGFEPTSPKRRYQLPVGDTGAGQTVYRRAQLFYSLGISGIPLFANRVSGAPYSKSIGIATLRSISNRPTYFHISVYGTGTRRPSTGIPLRPLTETVIESQQFEAIYREVAPGIFVDITPRFIPNVPTCQARIMVHDESGQRFFDVDVIGTRSFNVYAWGVTVFLLLKENGQEVDFQNPDSIVLQDGNDIGVEDDIVGARIVPVIQDKTENIQNRTITVRIDPITLGVDTVVPIPPGARTVQIISHEPQPDPADWSIRFVYNRISSVVRNDVGTINLNAGQSRSTIIKIPNAPAIAFRPLDDALPPTAFSLVFEVDA